MQKARPPQAQLSLDVRHPGDFVGALGNWWAGRKARKSQWRFLESALGQQLYVHTQQFFYGDGPLADLEDDEKSGQVQYLTQSIFTMMQMDNPTSALRSELVSQASQLSQLQVLAVTPEHKAVHYGSFPYVSGDLVSRINLCAQYCSDLQAPLAALGEVPDEELVSFCNARSALLKYHIMGLNLYRNHIGDPPQSPDWFRPLILALGAVDEQRYREECGFDSLLPSPAMTLSYSLFQNMVLQGQEDPFREFDEYWRKSYKMPHFLVGSDSVQREDA